MPGRISTGPRQAAAPREKRGTKKRALNAFSIAEQEAPERLRMKKSRFGETERTETKRRRDDSEEEDVKEEVDEEQARSTRQRRLAVGSNYGSDSEGNEWVVGKVNADDDDSLDSDEAFGESDEERFEGFAFRGSSSKKAKKLKSNPAQQRDLLDEGGEEELDSGEESEEFAKEAVDLATMLDDDDDDEENTVRPQKQRQEHLSDENEDESDEDEGSAGDDEESMLSISDEEGGADQYDALNRFVSKLPTGDRTAEREAQALQRAQEALVPSALAGRERGVDLARILQGAADSATRKQARDMAEDPKRKSKTGKTGTLDVPLGQRQQGRLDRAAAYEKSKETLNRWIDTVKHNRRADHLIFPLPNREEESNKNVDRLQPIADRKPFNEFEATIQNILIESGVAPGSGKTADEQVQEFEELAANKMSLEEVQTGQAKLRRQRELLFREEIRAKRIKKIKSKSYRRVHRRERARNLLREQEETPADGADEQERLDRLRAEERMGAKHRESKWAKSVKGIGRTAWDEDARSGVAEMARREEELKKRIQGKDIRGGDGLGEESDEDDGLDDSDEEAAKGHLENRLFRLRDESEMQGEGSKLANMAFMKKAEAARREQNEADIERLRRELAGEETPDESSNEDGAGRRNYGPRADVQLPQSLAIKVRNEFEERDGSGDDEDGTLPTAQNGYDDEDIHIRTDQIGTTEPSLQRQGQSMSSRMQSTKETALRRANAPEEDGDQANSMLTAPKKSSKTRSAYVEEDYILADEALPVPAPAPAPGPAPKAKHADTTPPDRPATNEPATKKPSIESSKAIRVTSLDDETSSSGEDSDADETPTLTRNQQLIHQALAIDVPTAAFAAEKRAAAAAERSPPPDRAALPGWGAWTGTGLSRRDRLERRRRNAALDKRPAAAAIDRTRRDAGLAGVIISERRAPKTARYRASQLPHPFESRAQYERSLRVPVGPEWSTKHAFQDGTRPRVLLAGGVVRAMERPMV